VIRSICSVIFVAASCLSPVHALAAGADCPVFPEGVQISDGQLFYLDGVSHSLQELKPSDQLRDHTPQPVQFYYIVRETSDDFRAGIVVIKSGRELQEAETDEPRSTKKVQLKRSKKILANNETCNVPPEFSPGSVSAETYDNFHDYGYDPRNPQEYEGDRKTLQRFHVHRYLGRNKACNSTDTATPDGIFRLDFRSNLSQFSFDPMVVAFGQHSQIWRAIRRVIATGSTGLANQRVFMKQYRADDSKIACISFKLDAHRSNFFLRINDLESGFLRKPENAWQLTR
jgi:hypothetical protein